MSGIKEDVIYRNVRYRDKSSRTVFVFVVSYAKSIKALHNN